MNTAILQVVEQYRQAIHTQDEQAFRALWASNDQGSLISVTRCFRGIEEIYRDFVIDGIQRSYLSIELIFDELEVRQISDDLAIVIFAYHTECVRRDTLEPYGIQGLETQVLIRERGQWKLQHIHYSK